MSRYAGVTVLVVTLVSVVAFAQPTKPSLVLAPVSFAPAPELSKPTKVDGRLKPLSEVLAGDFFDELERQPGITVPSKRLTESFTSGAKRKDWAETDEALAKLAELAATRYAMFVQVSYGSSPESKSKGVLVLARVVRSDGELVKEARTFAAKGKESLREAFKGRTAELFKQLELAKLPLTIKAPAPPAAQVPPTASGPMLPPPRPPGEPVMPPPPLPPLEVKRELAGPWKPVSYSALAVGGAAFVAGFITFAAAPQVRLDGNRNAYEADLGSVQTMRDTQRAGVGLIIAGAAVAAVGGAILLWAPRQELSGTPASGTPEASVNMSVVPTVGGAGLVVGGVFR